MRRITYGRTDKGTPTCVSRALSDDDSEHGSRHGASHVHGASGHWGTWQQHQGTAMTASFVQALFDRDGA